MFTTRENNYAAILEAIDRGGKTIIVVTDEPGDDIQVEDLGVKIFVHYLGGFGLQDGPLKELVELNGGSVL